MSSGEFLPEDGLIPTIIEHPAYGAFYNYWDSIYKMRSVNDTSPLPPTDFEHGVDLFRKVTNHYLQGNFAGADLFNKVAKVHVVDDIEGIAHE
jgi:hypothetical protein